MLLHAEALSISPPVPPTLGESRSGGGAGGSPTTSTLAQPPAHLPEQLAASTAAAGARHACDT